MACRSTVMRKTGLCCPLLCQLSRSLIPALTRCVPEGIVWGAKARLPQRGRAHRPREMREKERSERTSLGLRSVGLSRSETSCAAAPRPRQRAAA